MVTRSAVSGLAQNSRTNKIARARTSERAGEAREMAIREHYKKPLITVIHDLSKPAEAPNERGSRSCYSSRRIAVGNGFSDESKDRPT